GPSMARSCRADMRSPRSGQSSRCAASSSTADTAWSGTSMSSVSRAATGSPQAMANSSASPPSSATVARQPRRPAERITDMSPRIKYLSCEVKWRPPPTRTLDTMTETVVAPEHLDVVIVGAGLSGIGAAYRLQTECPGKSYAVLEARDAMGGTWDLFRYPGIRSDSDMFTLGYPFKPWRDAKSIADGPSILRYITETAAENGIDRKIRYRTK